MKLYTFNQGLKLVQDLLHPIFCFVYTCLQESYTRQNFYLLLNAFHFSCSVCFLQTVVIKSFNPVHQNSLDICYLINMINGILNWSPKLPLALIFCHMTDCLNRLWWKIQVNFVTLFGTMRCFQVILETFTTKKKKTKNQMIESPQKKRTKRNGLVKT